MTRRTTFSFDSATIERIKLLAARWNVSQAEAVRRAVEIAEAEENTRSLELGKQLQEYHSGGGIARDKAETYLDRVFEDRDSRRENR
ncbi:ribbon-helix-helix protein, CopG family [Marispirochaeta sp.]|uniref:ribbon-helix-helix protein, CopG family n=1 Tax=Marispirochaeta sp. TaxID=2038653 RepID=UPI0029C956E4|nr:ribbon-helix-helix protein, CopG family [Marispirochaeta sp.]